MCLQFLNDRFEFVSNNMAIEIVHVQAENKTTQNATRNNVSSFYGLT